MSHKKEAGAREGGAYLGCAVREVAVECFGRLDVITFSEAEVDKHRDVLAREKDVSRSMIK